MSLTKKQRLFIEAYLIDPNGKKAAIAAGYSEGSAAIEATRLLRNANVAAALDRQRKILSVRTGITPERVLAELAKLGFSDIRKLVNWRSDIVEMDVDQETGDMTTRVTNQVAIVDSDKIDDDTAAAILEVSQTKDGVLKVKMHDKVGPLVRIGQHLGMFPSSSARKPVKDETPASREQEKQSDSWDRLLN